jgi:hypothetical protein
VEEGKRKNENMSGSEFSSESEKRGAPQPSDYDFRHHLHDTIILLGGKREIADLLIRSQDYQVSSSDIDELRRYNATLIDKLKDRLAKISKIRIRPKSS